MCVAPGATAMAAFEYLALSPEGKQTRGVVAADTARAARRELKERRFTLLELRETAEEKAEAGAGAVKLGRGAGLSDGDRVLITRQLAMLIGAGLPVEEALNAIAQQAHKRPVRRVLLQLRSSVTEGFRLSDALAKHARAFGPLYRSMVAAGEAAGELGAVLSRLADLLEQSQKTRRKIQAAVAYPCVLAVVATFIVTALMVFVVPRVVEQFDTLDQNLPLLTSAVIAVSEFLRSYGFIVFGALVLSVIAFGRALSFEPAKRAVDGFMLRVPGLGAYLRGASAARFARTFGALLEAGVPVIESLQAAKNTISNLVMRDAIDAMSDAVRKGGGLSSAMLATKAFPPLLPFVAASGERSGELGAMFEKGADYLENETESSTAVALNLLEPFIIIVMGGAVALIVLSIMLPILQLNSLALS